MDRYTIRQFNEDFPTDEACLMHVAGMVYPSLTEDGTIPCRSERCGGEFTRHHRLRGRKAFTVTARGQVEVYEEQHDVSASGRSRFRCSELRGPATGGEENALHFRSWSSDCMQPRMAEGPPLVCGIDVTIGRRGFGDQLAAWECFRMAWERGIPAYTYTVTLDADGDGTARLFVTGRGSGREDGFVFNYLIAEIEVADFAATSRSYYFACIGADADTPMTDVCRGPVPSERGLQPDPSWEPMPWGGATLCGVEVLSVSGRSVSEDARECLTAAFGTGDPAQMVTIRVARGGTVSAELRTSYEPGVVHVYSAAASGVSRERCTRLDRVDSLEVFVLGECE